ncbi:MAG: hypothetical protein DI537_14405 [Stutzerimonas stutzeri]|nr:MAG: hypothetical protein DI537_14405 [Stutzerimonas stutzeri]
METVEKAPQLPLPILLAVTAMSFATLLLAIRRLDSVPGAFLLTAIWLRIISGAFYTITFAPLIGGLSINALLSVSVVGLGLLVLNIRTLAQRWAAPIYLLIGVIVASSVVNGSTSGAIDMLFKWGYVLVLIAATVQAMRKSGKDLVLAMVMWCYAPIFVFQMLSLVLGYGKDTEGDGGLSYIGGYNHEAAFSVMLATFGVIISLRSRTSFIMKSALLLLAVVGILLANYRTAIIAMLPVLAGALFVDGLSRFNRKSRAFVAVMLFPLVLLVAVFGIDALSQRFADLAIVVLEFDRFMVPPQDYAIADTKVLSGRMFIWANYVYGYLNGSDLKLIFGNGPNGWIGTFIKYAHNTLVSYLYELGPLGVLALLGVWTTFLVGTLSVADPVMKARLLCAQGCFFLFNLSTMPHWLIEGIIFFGLLQGTVLYQLSTQRRSARRGRYAYRERDVMGAEARRLA